MTEVTSYRISDLAKEFGVTTRTIRHYEELGMLNPDRMGQTRIYSRGDRTRLKLILRGKRLGLSLQESRDIIELYNPAQNNRQQLLRLSQGILQQKQRLREQLADLQEMLRELDAAETDCEKALQQANAKK